LELEEIDSFRSPGELVRFESYLANGIASGLLREIAPDPTYRAGELYGGRWFELAQDGSVWRLIPPDPPFTGAF